MRRIALLFVLVIGLAAASAARSQQPVAGSRATPAATKDSVVFKPSPELQKSLEEFRDWPVFVPAPLEFVPQAQIALPLAGPVMSLTEMGRRLAEVRRTRGLHGSFTPPQR